MEIKSKGRTNNNHHIVKPSRPQTGKQSDRRKPAIFKSIKDGPVISLRASSWGSTKNRLLSLNPTIEIPFQFTVRNAVAHEETGTIKWSESPDWPILDQRAEARKFLQWYGTDSKQCPQDINAGPNIAVSVVLDSLFIR